MKFPFLLLLPFITRRGRSPPHLVLTAAVPQCRSCSPLLNGETAPTHRRASRHSTMKQLMLRVGPLTGIPAQAHRRASCCSPACPRVLPAALTHQHPTYFSQLDLQLPEATTTHVKVSSSFRLHFYVWFVDKSVWWSTTTWYVLNPSTGIHFVTHRLMVGEYPFG